MEISKKERIADFEYAFVLGAQSFNKICLKSKAIINIKKPEDLGWV